MRGPPVVWAVGAVRMQAEIRTAAYNCLNFPFNSSPRAVSTITLTHTEPNLN